MSETPQKPEKTPANQRSYSTWFGFATREITTRNSVRIRIRWGRVAVFLTIMGLIAWFGKSWALYIFFKNVREFEDVAFTDMILFPLNRSNVRVQQGDYQIEQAVAALEREDYRRAYALLREGVARSPANLEGRMLLAQIYAGWRPELASELLVEGIEYGKEDAEFITLMLRLLLAQKQDEQVLELTETLLAEEPEEAVERILAVSRLRSAMLHGKFDIVREVIEETDLENTFDGLLLGVEIYERTDRGNLAIEVLLSAINSVPRENADPLINRLRMLYQQQEMYDRAREAALELVIRKPLEWQPRVALIDVLSASELYDRRDREISSLIKEHRNDEQAMIALARLAAEYGNVEAATRLYEIALENGYSLGLFSLTLAEAQIQDGLYEEAIELCNELIREDPAWMLNSESTFNAIRSLAYYGFGDEELGNLYLRNFIDSKRANSSQLFSAAQRFREAGLAEQARLILEEAYLRDPKNEQVLATLIDVEMDLGVFFYLTDHLNVLFELRRPDYSLIESIQSRLQSDRFLYTKNRSGLLDTLAEIVSEKSAMDWDIWERRSAS
ncbi:MAG: tetratricopeptide repeat protein [Puniceicoccaceae bacterium]